jgi:hypothetical protein
LEQIGRTQFTGPLELPHCAGHRGDATRVHALPFCRTHSTFTLGNGSTAFNPAAIGINESAVQRPSAAVESRAITVVLLFPSNAQPVMGLIT